MVSSLFSSYIIWFANCHSMSEEICRSLLRSSTVVGLESEKWVASSSFVLSWRLVVKMPSSFHSFLKSCRFVIVFYFSALSPPGDSSFLFYDHFILIEVALVFGSNIQGSLVFFALLKALFVVDLRCSSSWHHHAEVLPEFWCILSEHDFLKLYMMASWIVLAYFSNFIMRDYNFNYL